MPKRSLELGGQTETPVLKRVDFEKFMAAKGNGNRPLDIAAMEQMQDSLIARRYNLPQRLAILATAAQEMGAEGAASRGVGGNGYLGLSEQRMPLSYLGNTPKKRGEQIHYLLEDLNKVHSDNWHHGGTGGISIKSGQEGHDKFWSEPNVWNATQILNKSYIRPRDRQAAWDNRSKVAKNMQNYLYQNGGIISTPVKGIDYRPKLVNRNSISNRFNDIAYEHILPEITIVPDNSSYLASKYLDEFTKNIKDENIKNKSKQLIYNQLENNITSKGKEDITNKTSTNQKIINLYKIYKDAGSPNIKNNAKYNSSKNTNQLTEKRASYTPITNTIHTNKYVSAAFDIIPELAHALQRKKYGLKDFIQVPSDLKIKGKTAYEREGTTEYKAHNIIEPAITNYILTNEFKNGGEIYIKPSHRGRLTRLKARTGKSESELYNDGNPAHKKMVVFALNARKWNHWVEESNSAIPIISVLNYEVKTHS